MSDPIPSDRNLDTLRCECSFPVAHVKPSEDIHHKLYDGRAGWGKHIATATKAKYPATIRPELLEGGK